MKHAQRRRCAIGCLLFACLLETGCGGGGDSDSGSNPPPPPPPAGGGDQDPGIQAFTVTGGLAVGGTTTFNWTIVGEGDLTCRLDVNGDTVFEYVIDPCPSTGSQSHVYADGGMQEYRFEVSDEQGQVKLRKNWVSIDGPVYLSVVDPDRYNVLDSLDLDIFVDSDIEISTVQAMIAGRSVALVPRHCDYDCGRDRFVGSIPLDGLAGELILQVSATDALGTTSTIYKSLLIDRFPTVTVTEPLNGTVVQSTVFSEASCSDAEGECTLKLCDTQDTRYSTCYAEGTGHASATVDVSSYEGRSRSLVWTALDSRDQPTFIGFHVFVDSSPTLVDVDDAPGPITDADAERLLYTFEPLEAEFSDYNTPVSPDAPELWLLDRTTRDAVELTHAPDRVASSSSRLTPTGAIFTAGDSETDECCGIYEWWNGELIHTAADGVIGTVDGDYALYVELDPDPAYWYKLRLFLRQFSINEQTLLCEDDFNCEQSDVTSDGVAAFIQGTDVQVYTNGALQTLPTDSLPKGYLRTNGSLFVYREQTTPYPNAAYDTMLHDGQAATTLAPGSSATGFQINDDWLAYKSFSNADYPQIWLRDAQGVSTQRTYFATTSNIVALGPDGSIVIENDGRHKLVDAQGNIHDVNSTLGDVRYIDGDWYVIIGRSLFRVELD